MTGSYISGKKNGKWKIWAITGALVATEFWSKGQLTRTKHPR